MARLTHQYGEKMISVRASRVDYFVQHEVDDWINHLGSLGLEGSDSVFVNLAAVAGPREGFRDAMFDVNYKALKAAAEACRALNFGHFIQSSTQATVTERAGQVPYSRGKAMADFALSRMNNLPITICCLGLLYCRVAGGVGQDISSERTLNLTDLSLLPMTPILGDGSAPLQPLEVMDAARRISLLAFADPMLRPMQLESSPKIEQMQRSSPQLRVYDAVGPETMSFLELLKKFAKYQKNEHFWPVFIDYRNMERVLNVKSLGNLNRQFVTLLRSEQEGKSKKVIGHPGVFDNLLPDEPLLTLDKAMGTNQSGRSFPYIKTLRWALDNPKVIPYGLMLGMEILVSAIQRRRPT